MSSRILVVEDEAAIRDMLAFTLQAAGFGVDLAANAEQAWQQLKKYKPDLVLLDWMLPGVSGVRFAQRLRDHAETAQIPIIMLTAKGEEADQVEGFEAGVDDYVVKPFSPRALVARIQAVLRRQGGHCSAMQLSVGALVLDVAAHRVFCHGKAVHIGPTEFKLLKHLMQHPDRVFSRGQLLDQVWGEHVVVEERTVDVHIRRLRKALADGGCDAYIQTVRGAGYRLAGV
jgi:two-component system phosphate regulon response regulator PhoB